MTRFCSLPARTGLAFFVFALCAASLHAADVNTTLVRAEPETVGISSARLRLLDTMLRQHVDDGRVAGLVAGVARHGRIVYLEAMGSQVLAEGAQPASPMREDSIFQIRSNTKAITSLAVMQLIEAGRIGLDDPVSTYIPSFADMVVFTNPDDPDNSPTRAPSRPYNPRVRVKLSRPLRPIAAAADGGSGGASSRKQGMETRRITVQATACQRRRAGRSSGPATKTGGRADPRALPTGLAMLARVVARPSSCAANQSPAMRAGASM